MVDRLNLKLSDGNRVRSSRSSDNKKIMKIININNNNNIKFINSIIIYENTNINKIGILKLTKTGIYI